MRGSRPQATDVGIFPREEGPPPNSGPSSSKSSQGGAETGKHCSQDTWGTEIWKGSARSFLLGSHQQTKAGESVPPDSSSYADGGQLHCQTGRRVRHQRKGASTGSRPQLF